jgi:hypothetical protein
VLTESWLIVLGVTIVHGNDRSVSAAQRDTLRMQKFAFGNL